MAREVAVACRSGLYGQVHAAVEERLSRPSKSSFKPAWRDYFVSQLEDFRAGRPVRVQCFELPAGTLFEAGLRLRAWGRGEEILVHPDDRMAVVDSDQDDGGLMLFWDDL